MLNPDLNYHYPIYFHLIEIIEADIFEKMKKVGIFQTQSDFGM